MTQNKTLTDEDFELSKAITSFEVWTENRCKTHAELNEYRTHLCKEVWVAAKQESEKEIERLDELNKTQAIYIDDYIVKQVELQSQVNMLREALELLRSDKKLWKINGIGGQDSYAGLPPAMRIIDEALSEPVTFPDGYFKAEPFGWTDCSETDEGAIALYEAPQQQNVKDALEQAAKICEEQAKEGECPERAVYCAEAIRSLIKKGISNGIYKS